MVCRLPWIKDGQNLCCIEALSSRLSASSVLRSVHITVTTLYFLRICSLLMRLIGTGVHVHCPPGPLTVHRRRWRGGAHRPDRRRRHRRMGASIILVVVVFVVLGVGAPVVPVFVVVVGGSIPSPALASHSLILLSAFCFVWLRDLRSRSLIFSALRFASVSFARLRALRLRALALQRSMMVAAPSIVGCAKV